MILGDLGADVVKIENPAGGDDTRRWGPPYVGTESAYYLCANRNKKSMAIDISTAEGQQLVRRLAVDADVLVENYKLGGLQKFGLDHASLSALNPRLIYCSISGYGRVSPLAARPGYDYVIQAEGGLMSVTGPAEGEPMKVGVAVADLYTGMAAAQAILAALIAQARDGVGQHIDMALFDCQLAMLANVGAAFLASGETPPRLGNGHPTVVPYQLFATNDGSTVIAVGNDRQFAAFCKGPLARPELAEDARFATNDARVTNRAALIPLLAARIAEETTDFWLQGLRAAGIPCGEVRTVGEALRSPEAVARDMVATLSSGTAGRQEVEIVASPLKLGETPTVAGTMPPRLGEHTDALLSERLGLSGREIAELRAAGALGRSKGPTD